MSLCTNIVAVWKCGNPWKVFSVGARIRLEIGINAPLNLSTIRDPHFRLNWIIGIGALIAWEHAFSVVVPPASLFFSQKVVNLLSSFFLFSRIHFLPPSPRVPPYIFRFVRLPRYHFDNERFMYGEKCLFEARLSWGFSSYLVLDRTRNMNIWQKCINHILLDYKKSYIRLFFSIHLIYRGTFYLWLGVY